MLSILLVLVLAIYLCSESVYDVSPNSAASFLLSEGERRFLTHPYKSACIHTWKQVRIRMIHSVAGILLLCIIQYTHFGSDRHCVDYFRNKNIVLPQI